jgi:NADPH:quinone reductase-like Zn-dependent oxidoreductase
MKAVRLQAYGDVDQLRYEDAPNPVPGAREALVKIAVSGLNPVDLIVRKGLFAQVAPLQFPAILGVDAAGTIVAVGAGVTEFAVGDRVVAHVPLNGKGAYAEMAAAPVAGIAKLPANLTFEAGATLPLVALTGQQAVDLLGVNRGDRVLVSGALGAVGRVAVQYLRELGAVPVAGVRAARLAEGRALAGDALDIDLAPSSPDFDYAIAAAAPVAANTVKHVRDGGKVASAVQIPEGADDGRPVAVQRFMAHDDYPQKAAVRRRHGEWVNRP